MQRMARSAFTLLGVEDWNNSPYNIEGKVRKTLGLPAFDKWDDYRIDRMLSNMAGTGEFGVQEVLEAMNTRQGAVYDEGVRRANLEFAVGGIVGSVLGIPTKAYPPGEQKQRALQDNYFDAAYRKYELGDVDALNDFFDDHPEYETRQALFKEPEERLKSFLVNNIWSIYNEMPKMHKDELKEQLGDQFRISFLETSTRSYDSIPLDTMQVWLKLMNGENPGQLTQPAKPLELAPPEVAWRAQTFYDYRTTQFPDWFDLQKTYYNLKEGKARWDFRDAHPQLTEYWDWRRDWFHRNPDVVPYISDTFEFQYRSEKELREAEAKQPQFTWAEWKGVLGEPLTRLVRDYSYGRELSTASRNRLEDIAEDMGLSYEELLAELEEASRQP